MLNNSMTDTVIGKFRVLCQGPLRGEMYRNRSKCVISGSYREVNENCILMGFYAASIRNFLLTYRHK